MHFSEDASRYQLSILLETLIENGNVMKLHATNEIVLIVKKPQKKLAELAAAV